MSPVPNAENAPESSPPSPPSEPKPSTEGLVPLLLRLCEAMEKQAQAIDRLAASNEELVDALLDSKAEEEEITGQELDLAGRPLDS